MRSGEEEPIRPINITMMRATMPNTKAPPMTQAEPRPITMMSTPPNEAPDETPSTSGLTSGLRNTPCKTAPASASAEPTINDRSTRGRRTSKTMVASFENQV